jgi:hypothetical protein
MKIPKQKRLARWFIHSAKRIEVTENVLRSIQWQQKDVKKEE